MSVVRAAGLVCAWAGLVVLFGTPGLQAQEDLHRRPLVRIKLSSGWIRGAPLGVERETLVLLGTDGRLWQFEEHEVQQFEKTGRLFRPDSHSRLAAQWKRRLGPKFRATTTRHYVVIHPAGAARWAQEFETVYRSFWHYFSVRGFRLREPQFPLVAVVLRSQEEYLRMAARYAGGAPQWSGGVYSPTTNVVMLPQDRNSGRPSPEALARIVHEVTHQAAYNTGVHDRLRASPRWVVEGLATVFEVPGVWQRATSSSRSQRVHRDELNTLLARHRSAAKENWLAEMVARDSLFHRDPELAYARAWALSFYLAETRGRKYCRYLRLSQGELSASPQQRLKTFMRVFGSNLAWLQADLDRFLAQLR